MSSSCRPSCAPAPVISTLCIALSHCRLVRRHCCYDRYLYMYSAAYTTTQLTVVRIPYSLENRKLLRQTQSVYLCVNFVAKYNKIFIMQHQFIIPL